jgi:hypothetical protein
MNRRLHRVLLIIFNGFLALTAVLGGIGLLAGFNAPPTTFLAGSIFDSYLLPGLSLMLIVGGLASIGTAFAVRRHPLTAAVAAAAGLAIIVFETVEVWVIGSPPGVARNLQVLYYSVGVLILLVSWAPLADWRRRRASA